MDREDDDVESRLLMKECERELAAVMQLRWYAEEEMITNAQIKQSFELKKKNSVRNHSDKKPQKRRVSCNLQYSEETIHGRIAATTVRRQSFWGFIMRLSVPWVLAIIIIFILKK